MRWRVGSELGTYFRLPCCLLLAAWSLFANFTAHGDGAVAAEDSPPSTASAPVKAGDAASWVSKLNSDDFDERNAASDNLARLGEAAREALEKGASAADPEIKAAAADLLGKLGQATLTLLTLDRGGKPLAGVSADLTLYKELNPSNQQPQPVTTKADGTELLTKTEPSLYNLYLNWKKSSPVGMYPTRLKLVPGPNRIVVQLTRGGSCEARALDAEGKPLKDAKLLLSSSIDIADFIDDPTFQNRFGGRPELMTSTDEKGKAKLENVTDGVYRMVWTHDACEPTLGAVIRIHEGQTTQVPDTTLTAKSRGSLVLTLSHEDGKPLEKTHFFMSFIPATDDPAALHKALKAEYQQRMYDNGQPLQQTDEKGKVTLENLKPGKYHILLRTTAAENQGRVFFRGNGNDQSENMTEYAIRDVEIKTGASAEFVLKPATGAVMKGKIVNEKGEPCHDVSLSLIEENYLVIAGVQVFTQNYYDPAGMHSRYAQNKADGTFEIKNLRAGKYALSAHGRNGEAVIVYGIVVVDGKPVEVPEIKLPSPKKSFGEIKGKVLLNTGAPGISATVNLETISPFGSSSTGINTNQKGEFNFNMANYNLSGYLPTRIRVTLNGYHSAFLDLAAPDVKLDEIVVNLRKRDYGKLRVKAVDEAGKPLAGVLVSPVGVNPNIYAFGRQVVPRVQRTNAAGEVHFTGLADGPRTLQIELNGYFTDPDAQANVIKGDDESLFTATMHTGLKIAGQLELPAGAPPTIVGVVLTDRTGHGTSVAADADGKFLFSGLAPGMYSVTADLPGCGTATAKLTLTKDLKEPAAVKLKLVRNGGIAIKTAPTQAGYVAHLYPEALLKNGPVEELWGQGLWQDIIDGSGRAEVAAPDGAYRVMVSDLENYYDSDYGQRNYVTVMRSVASVTTQSLASPADLSKIEAQPAQLAPAKASVAIKLIGQYPPDIPKEKLVQPVSFALVSADVLGTFYYNMQGRQQQQVSALEPQIVGTPPKELQVSQSDLFTIDRLPAGNYKLYQLHTNSITGVVTVGKPVTEFSLKDGEKLELNDVKFDIPVPSKEELDQAQRDYFSYDGNDEDQDKVEVFKP